MGKKRLVMCGLFFLAMAFRVEASSQWAGLGGSFVGKAAVARDAGGKLNVFVRGPDNSVHYITQSSAGSSAWGQWSGLGGYIISDPVVGVNADGRLEVFVLGGDTQLWHTYQITTAGTSWSGW